jgi:hypothetical protein
MNDECRKLVIINHLQKIKIAIFKFNYNKPHKTTVLGNYEL